MSSNFSIRVGEVTTPEVSTSGASQTVEIGNNVGQTVEVGDGEGGYEGGGQQESGGYEGDSDDGGYLDQIVSQDMGSLSQPKHMAAQAEERNQERPQERQESPRHMRDESLRGRHFAPQAAEARQTETQGQMSAGVPMVDVSAVGSMSAESSRSQNASLSGNALNELSEIVETAAPVENRGATTDETTRRTKGTKEEKERPSVLERSLAPDTSSLESTQRMIEEEKPNSIFNRSFGYNIKDRRARVKQASIKRPQSIIDTIKDRMASSFKRSGVGYRIYQKMVANPNLDFRSVGVGSQEIMAAVNQNPQMLNNLLAAYVDEAPDVSGWNVTQIVEFINSHEIYVGTFKPPSNRGQDVQRRRLHVMTNEQRGIYLHPIMAAMYTADFDGDDMEVSLDPSVAELAKDPMEHMVGIDGQQSLNVDFLPVSRIIDGYEEGKTARDYVNEIILQGFADGRTLKPLVDAILELGETYNKSGDDQAAAWGEVFREARSVADKTSNGDAATSNATMSWICQSVYRNMQVIKVQHALTTMSADILDADNLPNPRTYADAAIYKILEGMVEGAVPNNFQELKVMLSGFIGNVQGKNAPFRFTADVGKMVKMDERLRVGEEFVVDPNNKEHMQMFFESTVKYAESRRMAREIKKAGRSQYYTQKMRDRVIKEVKFPEKYDTYVDFLNAFVKSYSKNSAIINEANLVFLSNMGISSDSNRSLVSPLNPSSGGVTLSDIAEPMISIYGTYSVGRMFRSLSTSGLMGEGTDPRWKGTPNHVTKLRKGGSDVSKAYEREYEFSDSEFWITGKYLNYNLRQFKNENRLIRSEGSVSSKVSTKIDNIDSRMSPYEVELYMLLAIADKRTGTASKFNTSVYGATDTSETTSRYGRRSSSETDKTTVQMMSDLLKELKRLDTDGTVSGRRDQMLWVDDVVEALIASGPDMFIHFGMDSTAGFLQSSWAKKMVEHSNDIEILGGIRTAMVFDYRMERINKLLADMPDPDSDRYADAYNNLEFARDELMASSEVWHGIITEFDAEATESRESVFQMILSGKRPTKTSVSGEVYEWSGEHFFEASNFWRNPGSHTTLRSVIEDLDMDRNTKWKVITDVVRYWENDPYLKSYEVGYQLEIGNDSTYSITSFGGQSALGTHRDFEKAFNRWGKTSQEMMQKEVDEATKQHMQHKGRLLNTLQRLDQSPWELIQIDDGMYADSIMSVLDKTYAQTEKASQNPWTNAIYAALSFQRNGGYMNDVTRTDDRLLGIQSVDSIGIQDIIHILADENATLEVYNQYGEYTMVTRKALLQNALGRELSSDIETDIWQFLQMEPRIASAIRRHNACVTTDTKGKGYLGASLSINETIDLADGYVNPLNQVKYLMRDHPIYAGIISMASPTKGAVTRTARNRIVEMENYLAYQIYAHASSSMSAAGSAAAILADLGITQTSIRSAMESNYDKFLKSMNLPTSYDNGEARNDADFTYMTVCQNLSKYIDQVRDNTQLNMPIGNPPQKPSNFGVDVVSVASFWDVLQELGGAKTSVSTGIEGAETYQFAEWASHISARDHYADLEAIFDDINDLSWNGMWTNLTNTDGSPMLLEVDEEGNIANYRELMQAKREQGVDEIVMLVPESYKVQDRSTDSHGNPVASLFAYMVSKRSNGAEAFNLKAKKAGLDGKDSVTKMQGKYRMIEGEDGKRRRASFAEIQKQLRTTAQQNGENGLMAARLELAKMLMDENFELGYKDLTLSNYMCIAELMLVQDESSILHLRSLEMLFSAIKYRLGSRVDEMSDQEIIEAANAIVNDTSENGVGIAEMSVLDALDGVRPNSKSSSVSGIRTNSSVFERNYDLLSEIEKDAVTQGIAPVSPAKARQLTDRYSKIEGISDVINRMEVMRNYSVIGYAGSFDGNERIDWTIGPSNSIVIGDGNVSGANVVEICHKAYKLGMTVIVSNAHREKIPSEYKADAVPCSQNGDVLIPCFDMRLNGSEASPYNGGRFAIFQAPFTRYVTSVEDSINEHMLGDAQYKPTKAFVDRIKVIDNGSTKIKAEDLFPNVFGNNDYRHSNLTVTLASGVEIERLIANGVRCTIDYGVVEGGNGFEQRKHDVDAAIERYQSRWSEADADGILRGDMTECAPGDIVAWAECEIADQLTGETSYVLAPIIPFQLHGPTRGVPEKFTVEQVATVDDDNTLMAVDWSNTSDITNSFAKYFDSSGGANKGMVDFADMIDDTLTLRDGTNVDAYCAKASTDSRKIGTDRRIKTMISLMALSRMHGYNFAKSDGAFPDDPGLKDLMLSKRIPTSYWKNRFQALAGDDGSIRFTTDPQLNAFLNYECRKILADGGNPSDYLANVYTDQNGTEHNTHVMWEFEAMFDQGLNYEDGLLKFLHFMDPTFCPNGVDDMREGYLFRLYRDSNGNAEGYDAGVLQMQVPHRMSNGSMAYLWDNVYIGMSFFGEDYSGFSRPNVDGASNFLDAMNTMSYYGAQLDEQSARFRAMWASADIGRVPRDGGALGKA